MKKLLLLATTILFAIGQASYAQNIENQIIASQFGAYQVPGIATGSLAFEPSTCQVIGGGKNFSAFTTGVPVKIVDANPNLTEVDTPSSVNITGCSISMATTYIHTIPFYVTSGTGGLQEALLNGKSRQGGPNTVILDAQWYTQVAPSNPATVIAAVKGNTSLGLVDVTTVPYTVYAWNGTNYAVVAYGGGANFPATPGIVYNTSTAASRNAAAGDIVTVLGNAAIGGTATNLSGTPALPNGVTATTGTVGENDNKLGTNAAIYASKLDSIPVTTSLLKGSGVAGKSSAATQNTDYLAPNYWASLTGCTVSGNVYSPQSNTCIAQSAGNPGGANTQIQVNTSSAFAGYSYFTFNPSTGAFTIGAPSQTFGTYSGALTFQAPYNTGTGTAQDTYDQYIQIGSGVNPFSQYVFDHPAGSTGGGGYYFVPPVKFSNGVELQSTVQVDTLTPSSSVCTDASSRLSTAACGGGAGTAVTPQLYGAKGDGLAVANGCTTNGTTSIVCPSAPFAGTSADVGKYVCVQGAGASGATFCSQVVTAVSNTTVTVGSTPPTSVTQFPTFVGHDDVSAVQQCFNASASAGVQCQLGTATPNQYLTTAGYLIYSAGLTIPTHANITGASGGGGGTNILVEYNGDAVSLPTSAASLLAGQPIQGVTFSNIDIVMDPLMSSGRGIHLNASAGVYGFGGMYYSTFDNVEVDNAAQECLWLDGGTGGADLPNQYITFLHFRCELPNQMHTAAAINGTGQMAQIIFQNGAIDGSTTHSNEPNPLISFSGSGGKFPADVKFFGYTCEVGTKCLYVGPNTTNIHYDSGYMEQIDNGLIVDTSAQGFTFNGNHLANTGNGTAVAQFLGSVTGSMRDNYVYGGSTPTAWAVCSGAQNSVVQSGNNGTNLQTSGCALQIAVSSGTQTANSCSSDTTITMPGITTDSVITIGYEAASESGVTGWGTTGGMRILGRPSAANTMSWHLCNPTGGNISYGAYTFKWGFTQQ